MSINNWKGYLQPPKQGVHQNGAPCQDNACIRESDERLVATLADGLGSLKHSEIASKAVTEALADYLLRAELNEGRDLLASDILDICRKAVASESGKSGFPVDEMDCTVLFALLVKQDGLFITGQLGDGAVCLVQKESATRLPVIEVQSKGGTNMTKTLFSSSAEDYFSISFNKSDDIIGIILTSDGLENELYSRSSNVKKNLQWYYNSVSTLPEQESRSLIEERWNGLATKNESEFNDDMSLAVIFRPEQKIELPSDANWLCICGGRNPLETSHCNSCARDITRVYEKPPFRDYGGKKQFFLYMNAHPDEEKEMLLKLCSYPNPEVSEPEPKEALKVEPKVEESETLIVEQFHKKNRSHKESEPQELENTETERKEPENTETEPKTPENREDEKKNQPLEWFGRLAKRISDLFKEAGKREVETEIAEPQKGLNCVDEEKERLIKENEALRKKLAETELSRPAAEPESKGFVCESGERYFGKLKNGLPSGEGVLVSGDVVSIGRFENGKKSGDFYIFYGNEKIIHVKYENGMQISNSEK